MVSMTLTDLEGFKIGTEFSPLNLHGLSHREIGDHSQAVSLLFEAPEPFLDATRGRTNADVLLTRQGRVRRAGRQEGPALRDHRRARLAHRQARRPPHVVDRPDARDVERGPPRPRREGARHPALRGRRRPGRRGLPPQPGVRGGLPASPTSSPAPCAGPTRALPFALIVTQDWGARPPTDRFVRKNGERLAWQAAAAPTILKRDYNSEIVMAKPTDNRFFRDMVASMRNGVLAIRRDGAVVFINDEARRILGLPELPGGWPGGDGVHYSELLKDHHDLVRLFAVGVRAEHAAQPRRAAPQAVRPRHRLHAVARPRRARARARRVALLQGPHAGRAGRGARAAARPPGRARRDGRHDRARGEEPAGQHRGDGGPAAAPGGRPRRPAGHADRHHQRGEDGQRHRPRGARVRAADPAAGGSHGPLAGGRGRHPAGRAQGAAAGDARRRAGPAGPADASTATTTSSARWSPTC